MSTLNVSRPPLSGRVDIDRNGVGAFTGDKSHDVSNELIDRWVAIVTCGFELTKCDQYVHMAKNLGLKIFIIDEPSNEVAKHLESLSLAHHVPVDLKNDRNLVQRVVEALELKVYQVYDAGERPNTNYIANGGLISGCFTIWDDGVCLASRVQRALGLCGDTPDVIDTCHNKRQSREKLEQCGIQGPKSVLVRNCSDIETHCKEMRYPIVIKPVNGAASIGVNKIYTLEELKNKFPTILNELKQIYDEDELMGLTFDDSVLSTTDDLFSFCVEEFIDGPEYDIDIVYQNGVALYANIGQDWNYKSGWFCERGMHHPAQVPENQYQKLINFATRYGNTLGCTTGVYHIEMKDDPLLGPQLIECNPRMGGGPVWNFHLKCWGVDLIKETANCFIGLPCQINVPKEPIGISISLLLFSDKSGILGRDVEGANTKIVHDPYTIFFSCPGKSGTEVRGWLGDQFPSHLGRVDFFIPKDDVLFPTAIEWGLSQRSQIIVPFEDGDHRDSNDDSIFDDSTCKI